MADAIPAQNLPYVADPKATYNTPLPPPKEAEFQQWVSQNKIPFDPSLPVSDYDMRGFYSAMKAGDPRALSAIDMNDHQIHYPDYWKTPYHKTFSNESQWATPDAPKWVGDTLVDKTGKVLFDDKIQPEPTVLK